MPPISVFLDIDGVPLDPSRPSPEYLRLMGEVLAPALGGTPEDWGRANAVVFPRIFAEFEHWGDDPAETDRHAGVLNVRGMCEHVGIEPSDDDECSRLHHAFDHHVPGNGDFLFDDSSRVVRARRHPRGAHGFG